MNTRFNMLSVCVLFWITSPLLGEEPRDVIKNAIKAHGGEDRLAKTLTGKLVATADVAPGDGVEAKITWEESFELPQRYKRVITGKVKGKIEGKMVDEQFRLEYAITKGVGWMRGNDGPVKDVKGKPLPLSRSWNATLATLPDLLGDDIKLSLGAKEKVGEVEAIAVKASATNEGECTLYFSTKTGLLMKSKRVMQQPLTGQDVDGEVVFSDYKEVSGVQYPHRVTSLAGQKKIFDLQITKIEFLKTLDDKLFEKP